MKRALLGIVIIVIAVPLVGALALWIAGTRNGAGHTGASIVIDRSAAQIWPYLTEPERLKQWTSGIQEITRESGGPGAVVGAKSRVVAGAGPDEHPFVMEHTYTLVDPPKKLGYTMTSEQQPVPFNGKFEIRLDEKNGSTTVTMLSETEYRGFVAKLFEPIITASAQSKGTKDLRALKTLVEREVPAGAMPATTATTATAETPIEKTPGSEVHDGGAPDAPGAKAPTETQEAVAPAPSDAGAPEAEPTNTERPTSDEMDASVAPPPPAHEDTTVPADGGEG